MVLVAPWRSVFPPFLSPIGRSIVRNLSHLLQFNAARVFVSYAGLWYMSVCELVNTSGTARENNELMAELLLLLSKWRPPSPAYIYVGIWRCFRAGATKQRPPAGRPAVRRSRKSRCTNEENRRNFWTLAIGDASHFCRCSYAYWNKGSTWFDQIHHNGLKQ